MRDFAGEFKIVGMTDAGAKCVIGGSDPFWLPINGHVRWVRQPKVGDVVQAVVPAWLAKKHRQLVGDDAFDEAKEERGRMERRQDGGALFKNLQREKDTHPHYRGDITIEGRKYWLSAWIKEGNKGKYMSLAVKPVEEKQEQPRQQGNAYASARGLEDDAIPF